MKSVQAELHPAFRWDCDECGRENFVRCVEVEGDPRDCNTPGEIVRRRPPVRRTAEPRSPEAMKEFEFIMARITVAPSTVTCQHCGESFAACVPFEGGPLDDDDTDEGDDEDEE